MVCTCRRVDCKVARTARVNGWDTPWDVGKSLYCSTEEVMASFKRPRTKKCAKWFTATDDGQGLHL